MKNKISILLNKLKNHKYKTNTKIVLFLICFISLFNVFSILSRHFSDLYRKYIFSNISVILSKLSSIFSFSIGEIMIIMGIILLIIFVLVMIMGCFKIKIFKRIRCIYSKIFIYILIFIYASETFNCFILYHTDSLKDIIIENYGSDKDKKISDEERLLYAYNEVVRNLNKLSITLERDDNGDLRESYTYEECKIALKNISNIFVYLKGYYPNPKKIHYSNIMSQQYLSGIYFPFSMEANYNFLMYCSNNPSTICHELSHLKGYIREDEANFISFMACINSDNDFIKYSGYLQVYDYLVNDVFEYLANDYFDDILGINEYVWNDDIFLKEEVFEKIEENAIISTDKLSEATDIFIDTNLKMNGIKSGYDNYSEVVKLIILYYDYIDEIY